MGFQKETIPIKNGCFHFTGYALSPEKEFFPALFYRSKFLGIEPVDIKKP